MRKYWFYEGEIDEHVYNFVTRSNNKPGNITGLVKAHKENYPFRVLTTGCGTAIENLSAFTEFFLGPLAQTHPAYIKDTTHFLNKIKDISEIGFSHQAPYWSPGTWKLCSPI